MPTAAARTRSVFFLAVLSLLALAPASAQSARQGSRCRRPVVTIASPARGASVSRRVVVQAHVCSSSRIRRVFFSVDGARKDADTVPPYRYAWDTRTGTDGYHTLRASAYDVGGRSGSSTATQVLVVNSPTGSNKQGDKKAPSVSLTAPKDGATVSGSVTVAAAATDNVGVTHVDFYLDGALFASLPSAPYSLTWNAALAAAGSHTWKATAFDAAGNSKTSSAVSVIVSSSTAAPAPPPPPPPPPSPPPPLPSPPATCTGVLVGVGADLQAAVNAAPSGATLCLEPGVHRLSSSVTLKSGDTLQGETGAILDGSKDISESFLPSGGYWVAGGQSQSVSGPSVQCESGKPLCQQGDDVFFDDRPLTRVGSLAALQSGTFFFDHAAQQIWIADNPAGHIVDATVADRAILGWGTGVDNVTITNLVVQHFAKQGIQCRGSNWTIDHDEIRYNHGDGLEDCAFVTYSNLHDNGKDGYVFGGSIGTTTGPYLFDHNRVTGNNYAGYDPDWEAGGAKFMQMSNLTVSNNYVANNDGNGLWADWGNQFVTYSGNDIENNTEAGIFHEASYDAVIANNHLVGNGTNGGSGTLANPGILMNDSQNVEMYGNYLSGNHNGIGMTQTDRGSTSLGPLVTQNVYVHDNTIVGSGRTGLVQWVSDGSFYTSKNNRFLHNSYDTGCDATPFIWQDPQNASSYAPVTVARWKADGEDTSGAFQATC